MIRKIAHILFFLAFLLTSLHAYEHARAPITIRGITLSGKPLASSRMVQGVSVVELEIPGDSYLLEQRLNERFIGKPIQRTTIASLRKEVADFFIEQGASPPSMRAPFVQGENGQITLVVAPDPTGKVSKPKQRAISLRGIALISDLSLKNMDCEGVVFEGVAVPGDSYDLKVELTEKYIGKTISRKMYQNLRDTITDYYRENTHKPVSIEIPYQNLEEGVVRLVVHTEGQPKSSPPPPPKSSPKTSRGAVFTSKEGITPTFRGILLVPSAEYVTCASTSGICGLATQDVCVPGGEECLAEVTEPLFMGRTVNSELIKAIKEEIIYYYRDHNHPVVAVYVPEQEITNGVVKFVVMEGVVCQVGCSGNCWFPSWFYERSIRLGAGDAITADTLLTDVSWINRNPFVHVDAVFTPGSDPGTTNIELLASDRFPIQIYVGGDNTGTAPIGTARWFTGATWGNAFWLGHIINYQFTTASNPKEMQAHTFHYTAPLPWHNILIFYGGYARVVPDIEDVISKGENYNGSLRYVIPCGKNYNGRLQEFTVGFDAKNFNNNLLFIGEEDVAIIADIVNLSQFVLGYAFGASYDWGRVSLDVKGYGSPGKMLPNESARKYGELSTGAKVNYVYGHATLGSTVYLPKCAELSLLARGQLASGALLPSERFGLGGYDTVRGYDERIYNADEALVLNVELKSPTFSFFRFFGWEKIEDEMLFLAFFDYGRGHILVPQKIGDVLLSERPRDFETLMGVGPGWRWNIGCNVSARVDWGIRLTKLTLTTQFGPLRDPTVVSRAPSRVHAGFVVSF